MKLKLTDLNNSIFVFKKHGFNQHHGFGMYEGLDIPSYSMANYRNINNLFFAGRDAKKHYNYGFK
jgi:hypothetical protein